MKTGATSAQMPAGVYKLGIVTPLANEEENIRELLRQIVAHLRSEDRVFCVVDNVSKDNTRAIIAEISASDPRVVLVWAPENRCVVDAYFAGYRAAMNAGMDYILEMDGGFSHNPAEIPRFFAAIEQGAEYAGGTRFKGGGRHVGPLNRYLVSRGGTLLTNLVLGTAMSDMCSGFELFSRKAMQVVLDQGVWSRRHFFQTEIRYRMHDFKWIEVPITYSNPSKSVGSGSLKEAFANLYRLWKLKRQRSDPFRYRRATAIVQTS